MIYFAQIELDIVVANRVRSRSLYHESQFKRGLCLIKIGCTRKSIESRLTQLRSVTGKPVTLLAWMEGGPQEEAEIHQRFDNLRLPAMQIQAPEWFYPGKDLLAFIEEIPRPQRPMPSPRKPRREVSEEQRERQRKSMKEQWKYRREEIEKQMELLQSKSSLALTKSEQGQ